MSIFPVARSAIYTCDIASQSRILHPESMATIVSSPANSGAAEKTFTNIGANNENKNPDCFWVDGSCAGALLFREHDPGIA